MEMEDNVVLFTKEEKEILIAEAKCPNRDRRIRGMNFDNEILAAARNQHRLPLDPSWSDMPDFVIDGYSGNLFDGFIRKSSSCFMTPEIAKLAQKYNIKNRKVYWKVVDRYATDIKNGLWNNNVPCFIFITKSGIIVDGQHRILAVIRSGIGIWVVFVVVDIDAQKGIDFNKPRTAKNIFELEDIDNGQLLQSACRLMAGLSTDVLKSKTSSAFSAATLYNVYEKHPRIVNAVEFASREGRELRKCYTPTVIAFLRFVTSEINPGLSDSFFKMLSKDKGSMRQNTDPEYNVILRGEEQRKNNQHDWKDNREIMALTILAWNLRYNNQKGKVIFTKDDLFPTFDGIKNAPWFNDNKLSLSSSDGLVDDSVLREMRKIDRSLR